MKPAALRAESWAPCRVLPPPTDPWATPPTAAAATSSPLTAPTSAGWRPALFACTRSVCVPPVMPVSRDLRQRVPVVHPVRDVQAQPRPQPQPGENQDAPVHPRARHVGRAEVIRRGRRAAVAIGNQKQLFRRRACVLLTGSPGEETERSGKRSGSGSKPRGGSSEPKSRKSRKN